MQYNDTVADNYIISAMAAHNKRNYAETIALCDRGLEINPKATDGYWCRAISYLKQGSYQKAIDDVQEIMRR